MSNDNIPDEHRLKCETCGKIIDMRDLGQVLSHGNFNADAGKYQCLEEEIDLPYTSSKRVGEAVEWTKDKKPINLN